MVPAANLVGFGGQELARKLPTVLGVVLETTLGSLVEMVLFIVLLVNNREQGVPIVQAAILGSILANLLLCMGLCFFFGGLRRHEQTFHDAVSDIGSNLMLVAGFALVIPVTYANALTGRANLGANQLELEVVRISRATAIVLLLAFAIYTFYQMKSHHSIYDDILEQDEQNDADRHRDLAKPKLTFTESIIALALAITFVSMMAVFLVQNIEPIVHNHGVSDAFVVSQPEAHTSLLVLACHIALCRMPVHGDLPQVNDANFTPNLGFDPCASCRKSCRAHHCNR